MSRNRYSRYLRFPPYISVAERKEEALKEIKALKKKGRAVSPVQLSGNTIAKTFWGKSWCSNLEAYSDYSNRLPRGRSYLRSGAVVDLQIGKGKITALVRGASLYSVDVSIKAHPKERWHTLIHECSGQIDSLVELLQGKFSKSVMAYITDKQKGLFPTPKQISFSCSCPDGAYMCKHVAAALYGVGTRLDDKPELFFKLRHLDHLELIAAGTAGLPDKKGKIDKTLQSEDLSKLFGIELASGISAPLPQKSLRSSPGSSTKKRVRIKSKIIRKAL